VTWRALGHLKSRDISRHPTLWIGLDINRVSATLSTQSDHFMFSLHVEPAASLPLSLDHPHLTLFDMHHLSFMESAPFASSLRQPHPVHSPHLAHIVVSVTQFVFALTIHHGHTRSLLLQITNPSVEQIFSSIICCQLLHNWTRAGSRISF